MPQVPWMWLSSVLSGLVLLLVSGTLNMLRGIRKDLQAHAVKFATLTGELNAHLQLDIQRFEDNDRRLEILERRGRR